MQSVLPAREQGQVSLMSSIKMHVNSCVHCHAAFPSLSELCRSDWLRPGPLSPPRPPTLIAQALGLRRQLVRLQSGPGTSLTPQSAQVLECGQPSMAMAAPKDVPLLAARAHLADAAAGGARHQAAQAQAGVEVELQSCRGDIGLERCSLSSAQGCKAGGEGAARATPALASSNHWPYHASTGSAHHG